MAKGAAPQYFWAIVGDNKTAEPVLVRDDKAYTIGCPDPFNLAVADPAVRLIPKERDSLKPMEIPRKPETVRRSDAARQAAFERNRWHGYMKKD